MENNENGSFKLAHIIVTRQDAPDSQPYEESFAVQYRPGSLVISLLLEIRRNPVNASGELTSPVCWESVCMEEVCGACAILMNGRPRPACSTPVDSLKQPIRLQPLSAFPVIRDLMVDRTKLFRALKQVKAWIPIDGTQDLGPGPRIAETERQWAYELSRCMSCGICLEACPNVHDKSPFIGPAAISQVRLMNAHPTGKMYAQQRLEALLGEGGIEGCGNAQNCARACPLGIDLTTSIAQMNQVAALYALRRWMNH